MARMWLMAALLLLSASAGSCGNPNAKNRNKVSEPTKGPINTPAPQRPDEAQIVNDLQNRLFTCCGVSRSLAPARTRIAQFINDLRNRLFTCCRGFRSRAPQRPDEAQIRQIVDDLLNRYQPSYELGRDKPRYQPSNELGPDKPRYQPSNELGPDKPRKSPMFSLAVSIPNDNNNKYDVSKVTDSADNVKNKIVGCDVYTSERMVAATLLKWDDVLKQCPNALVPWRDFLDQNENVREPWKDVLIKCPKNQEMTWDQVKKQCSPPKKTTRADHAEYRVLQNFNTLKNNPNNKQDFLLFYVLASPCDQQCASEDHPANILGSINVIKQWANYAVVFSKVFKPRGGNPIPAEKLKGALERLGAQIGLQNIYRCDGSVPCTRCSSGNNVTPYCYSDPQPDPNAASTSVNVPPGGKANVPPQTGQKNNKVVKGGGKTAGRR